MPERRAVGRRQARVREILHTLPPAAQEAIRADLDSSGNSDGHQSGDNGSNGYGDDDGSRHHQQPHEDDAPTASIPVSRQA
jgi:phospholipid/cholesterol/gamma-HCH transport system ATP-binding protein